MMSDIDEYEARVEIIIYDMFKKLGIPSNFKGYHYLKYGVFIALDAEYLPGSLTKVLYPAVAKKFSSSSAAVERAMRNAISTAWLNSDISTFSSAFHSDRCFGNDKPTNGEFINEIVEYIRHEINC